MERNIPPPFSCTNALAYLTVPLTVSILPVMKRGKHIGCSNRELDELYERTDSWKDTGPSLEDGKDVDFVLEDLSVYYALPANTAKAIARLARRKRTSPERLIRRWVEEKLAADS